MAEARPLAGQAGNDQLQQQIGRDPTWLRRWATLLLVAVLIWPLLVWTEFKPANLIEPRSLASTWKFLSEFVPPRADPGFLLLLAKETWRTIAIATAGMTIALLFAVPLALGATARLSISALTGRMAGWPLLVRQLLRWAMVILRSIPELVWALVFVRVVGLGPTAGVLAIGIAYGGMLGKVYAEILESTDAAPTQALLRNGSGRLQALLYGAMPQCANELVSYTVYRWECAIRSSVVLGLVGAGGLGQLLDGSAKMFAGSEVSAILIVFVLLVTVSDRISLALRRALG
ncbi:PhnE/PtxC family ABC transporter permease [Piscinibacter sakaiensis]|uniref:PhnE/PtxC family ABC transporter permease n=1 Tax=Piscinibacter sakaiensis TaxID=1547922 RepID=UPI003AB0F0E4